MMNLGMPELMVILVLVVLVFGVNRLPKIGRSLGEGIREFRKIGKEIEKEEEEER